MAANSRPRCTALRPGARLVCSPARSRMLTVALENGSLVPGLGPPGAPTPQRQRGDPHQPILRLLFTVLKNRRPQNHERERGSLHHRRNTECLQGKHALKKERQLGKPSATLRTDHSGTGHEPPFLEKMLAARAAGAGGSRFRHQPGSEVVRARRPEAWGAGRHSPALLAGADAGMTSKEDHLATAFKIQTRTSPSTQCFYF